MDTASSESATVALRVPTFTSRELYERIDDVLGEDITGTVYSLKGCPGLAVKEIPLNGLDRGSVGNIKAKLTVILALSYPGVLKYYQVIEHKGLIYIVMDRYDKTLKDLLTEHKRRRLPVSVTVVLSILRQLAAALAYLHSASGVDANGLVHRDLRPANILISADGEYFVIAGLGLSRDALWSESTFPGTAAYRAPEVLLRSEASPASDMWSLGAIVYELATLRRPDFLGGREPREVFVDGWRPDLSAVADDLIRGILERIFVLDPEKRQTVRELCEMLITIDTSANELGHRCVGLEGKCSSLETALNGASARITALEAAFDARSIEVASLKETLEMKAAKIALEDQGKEHLAMIKALENRFTQSSSETNTSGSQTDPSLLTELMRAAHTNNVKTVKTLVTKRVSIGQRDERGMTALMHAAQQGHIDPVNLLVETEKGLKDKSCWTALMHAAHENHFEIVEILAPHEHGNRNKNNCTALMIAAENGSAEAASVLAPYEKDLIDSKGNTALIIAAEAGHEAVVEALDPTDDKGVTALMRAARRNDTLTARALIPIQKGRAASTGTALIQAAVCGHVTMVRLLMQYEGGARNGCGATALMRAASMNHIKVVQLLMEREGYMKDICGVPAITHAAYSGHLEIVKLLFEKEGHLIDKSDKLFFSELEAMGYSEIASFLRNSSVSGADDCNDHQAAP